MIDGDERADWTGPGGVGTGWACDVCQQPIAKASDGWLEWVRDDRVGLNGKKEPFSRDVQIVHGRWASPLRQRSKHGCSIHDLLAEHGNPASSGGHLGDFLGTEGLEILQSLVSSEKGAEEGFRTAIRRLHEPGYEQVYVEAIRAEARKEAESTPAIPEL